MTTEPARRRKLGPPTFDTANPTAPTAPAPSPAPSTPETASESPARTEGVPAMSDSVNTFVHMFTESDTEQGDGARASDRGVIDALLTPPTVVDPDLKLVHFGARIPEYVAEAIRLTAFAQRRRQQDIIIEALRRGLDPALLARARRAAGGGT